MVVLKIKRKSTSNVTFVSNALFSMRFPSAQNTFEIPENYYAYLRNDFVVISRTVVDDDNISNVKPCWADSNDESVSELTENEELEN